MPRTHLTRDEVRDIDREAIDGYGLPGIVLMENAGRGCAQWLSEHKPQGPVVICCGKGNNGGDGFVIARHLQHHVEQVSLLLAAPADDLSPDAACNHQVLEQADVPMRVVSLPDDREQVADELNAAEWIVDALLGTGVQGEIREPYASLIELINSSPARTMAIDLPSGLDCDTGEPLGACVCADCTATFVAQKQGFASAGSKKWTGEIRVIDIGVPRKLLEESGLGRT